MSGLEQKDICEVMDVDDARFQEFLATGSSGVRIVAEEYGQQGEVVLKPDTGDFVKWLKSASPELHIDIQEARRLVLHSNDVWMPLVFLAKDIGLPLYLNLVSSYLYDRFKAAIRGDKARVHLKAEYLDTNSGVVKRFTFEGDHDALKDAIKKFDLNEFMNG